MDRRQRFFRDGRCYDYGGINRPAPSPRRSGLHVVAAMMALALSAVVGHVHSADIPLDQRRSGYTDLSRDSKAMQDDDTVNPATLWVFDGEALWNQRAGAADASCADCHGDATVSLKGVAARYPAFSPALNGPIDLEQRINLCRTEHQRATALPFESHDLVALTVYVGRQSRGIPIAEASDERLKPFIDRGA
jgi:L-cysteine S-thiosulfotransferase